MIKCNIIIFFWALCLFTIYVFYILKFFDRSSIIKKIDNEIYFQINNISYVIKSPKYMKTHFAFVTISQLLTQNYELLKNMLENEFALYQIIVDSYKKLDYQSTNICLLAYVNMVKKYMELIHYDIGYSDKFLTHIMERMDEFINYDIKNDKITFLRQVIRIIEKLTEILSQNINVNMNHISVNPINALLSQSLFKTSKLCIVQNRLDAIIPIIYGLGNIGSIATYKTKNDQLTTEFLLKLGDELYDIKDSISCSICVESILKIFKIRSVNPDQLFDDDFERFTKLSSNIFLLPNVMGLYNLFDNDGAIIHYVKNIVSSYTDDKNNFDNIVDFTTASNNICHIINYIDKTLVNYKNNIAIDIEINCTMEIARLYLNTKHYDFIDEVGKSGLYVHTNQIPYTMEEIVLFLSSLCSNGHEKNTSHSDVITTHLSKIAIISFNKNYEKYVLLCIDTLYTIIDNKMNNEYNPMEIHLLLNSLIVIGCCLLKSKNKMLDDVINKIIGIDTKFIEKYNYSINRSTIYNGKSDHDVNINLLKYSTIDFMDNIITKKNIRKFETYLIKEKIRRLNIM